MSNMTPEITIVCISFFLWLIYRENKRLNKEFESCLKNDLDRCKRSEEYLIEMRLHYERLAESWEDKFHQSEKYSTIIQKENIDLRHEVERLKLNIDNLNIYPDEIIANDRKEAIKNAFCSNETKKDLLIKEIEKSGEHIKSLISVSVEKGQRHLSPRNYRKAIEELNENIQTLAQLWKQQNS